MSSTIIGWGHTAFGRFPERGVEDLLAEAASGALAHAGVPPEAVDGIFLGWFNGGFVEQEFGSSLIMNAIPALRYRPATRFENACATGSAALYAAADRIEAGRCRCALVLGVESMSRAAPAEVARRLLRGAYLAEERAEGSGFAGVFARIARAYFRRYGEQLPALAAIAAKNHRNACANPWAQLHKDLGVEFCLHVSAANPMVAPPLKRSDCAPVSDGAAALVLVAAEAAAGCRRAVALRARAQVNDLLPTARRDMSFFDAAARAWKQALGEAGLALSDLDLVETHDCFTIAELMQYEAMGLTAAGAGATAVAAGWTQPDGRLPVNLSGGLKAKGHPIGATGVSMHVLAAMQLAGEAGAMQKPGAEFAGVFNMGGAGVANYCSILQRAA